MSRIALDPATDILGIIDVQPTFMPGGELPVADGDAVVPAINSLLAGPFRHAFATQDWHPQGHISFASSHPGRAPFDDIFCPMARRRCGRIMRCRAARARRSTRALRRRALR